MARSGELRRCSPRAAAVGFSASAAFLAAALVLHLDALERLAFNIICHVASSHSPCQLWDDGMDASEANCGKIADALCVAAFLCVGCYLYAVLWLWKINKVLHGGSERRLPESVAVIQGFADRIIQSRRVEMLMMIASGPVVELHCIPVGGL